MEHQRVIPKCHSEMFFGPRRPPHRAVQSRGLTELDGRLDDQAGEHVDLERLVDGGLHGRHLAAEVGLLHHRGVLVFAAGRWRSHGQVHGSGEHTGGGGGEGEHLRFQTHLESVHSQFSCECTPVRQVVNQTMSLKKARAESS